MSGRQKVNNDVRDNKVNPLCNFSDNKNNSNRKYFLKINDIIYFVNNDGHVIAFEQGKERSVSCTELYGLKKILNDMKNSKYQDLKVRVNQICEHLELKKVLDVFFISNKNGLRVEIRHDGKEPVIDFQTIDADGKKVPTAVGFGLKDLYERKIAQIQNDDIKLANEMKDAFNIFNSTFDKASSNNNTKVKFAKRFVN